MDIEKTSFNLIRISSFILLTFMILSSNFISQIIPCSIRELLEKSQIFKHIIGCLIVFVFIMLEGGWSIKRDLDKNFINNWSSADVVDSLILSFLLYVFLLLTTKISKTYYLLWLANIFLLYCFNTQRRYWLIRDLIDSKMNNNIIFIEFILCLFIIFVFLLGLIDNYFKHIKQNKQFNIFTYLFNIKYCKY